tara:strand:- start:3539 stop:3820 length:282 start_codon:yes stop_codon:yes gene_type:complete
MSVKCCGWDRTTSYCCTCGKKLTEDFDLNDLLLHCKAALLTAEKTLVARKQWEADDGGIQTRSVKSAERSIRKWGAWSKLLEEVKVPLTGSGE